MPRFFVRGVLAELQCGVLVARVSERYRRRRALKSTLARTRVRVRARRVTQGASATGGDGYGRVLLQHLHRVRLRLCAALHKQTHIHRKPQSARYLASFSKTLHELPANLETPLQGATNSPPRSGRRADLISGA